jgi:hypothetical protein
LLNYGGYSAGTVKPLRGWQQWTQTNGNQRARKETNKATRQEINGITNKKISKERK